MFSPRRRPTRWTHAGAIGLAMLLLTGMLSDAWARDEEPLAQPPAEAIDRQQLSLTSRTALHAAVDAIMKVLEEEENDRGLLFKPHGQRKVVDQKEVTTRWKKKMVTVPVYKKKYKDVWVLERVKEGSVTVLKRVKRRKEIGRVKTGYKQVERTVRDPEGDIYRKEMRNVYGPGGPDILPVGFLGDNAMALYTLIQCGKSPTEDPAVERLADSIVAYVDAFGIPDYTWDVAWMTIALSNCREIRYEWLIEQLVRKLTVGQIKTGKARGLWGPVCVDPALIRKLLEYEQRFNAEVVRLQRLAEQSPDNPVIEKQLEEAKLIYGTIPRLADRIARQALRFDKIERSYRIEREEGEAFAPGVVLPGLPLNIYREMTADLESTALAVFALHEVNRLGKLPRTVKVELDTRVVKATLYAEPMNVVLMRTVVAVGGAQHGDGRWDEMNHWQAVNDFAGAPSGAFGLPVRVPAKIESRKTWIATAYGLAAMRDLATLVSNPVVMRRYEKRIHAARRKLNQATDAYLRQPPVRNLSRHDVEVQASSLDGLLEPHTYLFRTRWGHADESDVMRMDESLLRRAMYRFLRYQSPNGWWQNAGATYHFTSSLRERNLVVRKRAYEEYLEKFRADPKNRGKKPNSFNPDHEIRRGFDGRFWGVREKELGTLCMMLHQVHGVRHPAGIAWSTTPGAATAIAPAAAAQIREDQDVDVVFDVVERLDEPINRANGPAVIIVSGLGKLGDVDAATIENIAGFVRDGGTAIVEADDNNLGRDFINDALRTFFAKLELKEDVLAADSPWLEGMKQPPGELRVLLDGEGEPVVFVMPVRPRPTAAGGSVTTEQAGRIVASVIERRAPSFVLEREYPTDLGEFEGEPELDDLLKQRNETLNQSILDAIAGLKHANAAGDEGPGDDQPDGGQ